MGFFKDIKGDKVIWGVVLLLSIFSILAVYSSIGSLAYEKQGGNTGHYILKHSIILAIGLFFIYLAHKIKYIYFSPVFKIALFISIPLLLLTLFRGVDLNDAKRVLQLPFNLTFQTSDLAKLTLITYLAHTLTKKQNNIKDFRSAFVPLMVPVLLVVFLILPANLSTGLMILITSLVLMFIGRVNMKYIFALLALAIVVFLIFIAILKLMPGENQGRLMTWKNRVENKSDTYQVEQSKIAISSGGLFGKGPGNSTQRNFLPHPYSDFIYAIIIEEYGLIGGLVVMLLYLILLFRAVVIVTKIPQTFGAFLTIGVTFSLVLQAMINMAVAADFGIVTGQPLPLVSMGGTSIWFTSLSFGIILSVSKEVAKKSENPQINEEAAIEDTH